MVEKLSQPHLPELYLGNFQLLSFHRVQAVLGIDRLAFDRSVRLDVRDLLKYK
jgi:hypothetical protein